MTTIWATALDGLPLGSLAGDQITSTDANLAGYPADLDGASRQYFHARRILR
jgi:hypothetical protein